MSKFVYISGHCKDCFCMSFKDTEGKTHAYDGYVIPPFGNGDDIELQIDIETGMIKNWKALTETDMIKLITNGDNEDESDED